MNPRRKKRLFVITFSVTLVGAAIGLMLFALQQNIDLFYTPSEIIEGKELANGKRGQKPQGGNLETLIFQEDMSFDFPL